MIPGEFHLGEEPIEINAGRPSIELSVLNTGDRPIQVGSHYHFAETNSALHFDRDAARGFRLDIPAGTAIRFEPGDAQTVQLVAIGGARRVYGLDDQVDGPLDPGPGATGPAGAHSPDVTSPASELPTGDSSQDESPVTDAPDAGTRLQS